MTATPPTEPFVPVGMRYGTLFQLTAGGLPNATAVAVAAHIPSYDGIEISAPKAFNLTVPNPRTVPQIGNDRLVAVDLLPPIQPYVGEINVSAVDFDFDAAITNTKKTAIGGMTVLPRLTDQQGFEPVMGVMSYQQALLRIARTRVWHAYVIPATRLVRLPAGFAETAQDVKYYLTLNPSGKYLWGQTLTLAVDGATESGLNDIYSVYKPHIAAWLSDGASAAMDFSLKYPAVDAAHVSIFVETVAGSGITTLTSAGVTVATTGLTWSAIPTASKIVVTLYEVA